jgi:hypothetical protein
MIMRKIQAIVVAGLVASGLGLGATVASAAPAEVRVSERQVGAECFERLAEFPSETRFGRVVRDVPAADLRAECGIGTVRASDGSLVPSTFYSQS